MRRDLNRERRYPVLATIDFIITWSISLSACVLGLYAVLRVVLFFMPYIVGWLRAMGV